MKNMVVPYGSTALQLYISFLENERDHVANLDPHKRTHRHTAGIDPDKLDEWCWKT